MSYSSNLIKELQSRGITVQKSSGEAAAPAVSEPVMLPETNYNNRLINILNTRSYISQTSGVGSFLRDADDFFRTSQRENTGNNFNAAEFFEQRRTQAENLKTRAADISRLINDYDEVYLPKSMRGIKEYLSSFNTQVDDVLGYYQKSASAKTGMAAYQDEMVEAMERNQKIAQAMGNPWNMPEITNPAYGFINAQNQYRADSSYRAVNDQWTDEERYVLGLLQQEDPSKAREYAMAVNQAINDSKTADQRQSIRNAATQSGWAGALHTAGALGSSVLFGIPEMADRLAQYTARGDIMNRDVLAPWDYSQEVVGGITDALNEKYKIHWKNPAKVDLPATQQAWVMPEITNPAYLFASLQNEHAGEATEAGGIPEWVPVVGGKGVGDLYNMGYSMAQNVLSRNTLGRIGGTITMGPIEVHPLMMASYFANSAVSGMDEARKKGATSDQAVASGIAKGTWEVATEMFGLDNLYKMGPAVTWGDLFNQMGVQGLFEAFGEASNEALSILSDKYILGDLSDYEQSVQAYMEQGMDEEKARFQAFVDAAGNVAYAGLSGYISGMVSGGTEIGLKTGLANQYYRSNVSPEGLIDAGMELAEDGKAFQMAQELQRKLDAGENISGNDKRMLDYYIGLETQNQQPVEEPAAVQNQMYDAPVKVSSTGRSIKISTQENVDALDFASVGNGNATIQLKDGGTADYSDISFATEGEANRFRAVASLPGIDTESANDALHALAEQGAGEDIDSVVGIRDAYGKGYYGAQETDLAQGDSANLSADAQKVMYDIGRRQRDAQALVTPTVKTAQAKPSEGYKRVVIEGKDANVKLTGKQTAEIQFMDFIADNFSGTTVHVFKSYKGRDGKFYYRDNNGQRHRAPNGKYKNDEIWVDLNAGDSGEGLVLNTFAHEMYHHVKKWSPQKANELGEFIVKELGLNSVETAVAEQIKKARKAGLSESYFVSQGMTQEQAANRVEQNAWEDFIADSLETVFTRGDAAKVISDLRSENKTLFAELKRFVDKWVSKLKKFYNGKTISKEGELVSQLENFQKIQKLFMEAMDDAGQNFSAALESVVEENAEAVEASETPTDGAYVTDGEGTLYSIRSMKSDIAEGRMFEDLKTYCGWTQAQVDTLRKQMTDLVAYMTPYRDILDMNETYGREGRRFSPYKPNSDPLYKISMDFSTLCSKRLLTQYVIENLQLRENRPMSAEEQMAIRDILNEYRSVEKGLQVACAMCYVEAARLKSPKQMQKWMSDPEVYMRNYFADKDPDFSAYIKGKQEDFKESRGYDRNTPKKDMKSKDVTEFNKIRPRLRAEYQPSTGEQAIIAKAKSLPNSTYLTAANLANLSESDPTIYAAYTAFVRTATRSKSLETDEPYYYGDSRRDNGNGIVVTDDFIESVNRENGMRFSSWSDWRIQHMLDYITAVIDNSVRGAAMHGYTKFPEEVRVLGNTGMMFNMSGVAGSQTGLNEDGSLSFSPTESIDVGEAVKLREEFPETAGLQCIGVSDAHITALLRSDIIDYVIPYHVSGLNKGLRTMANIHGWKDYTSTQHAAIDKSAKLENASDKEHWREEPVFSEFFVGYDTGMTGIEAMRASADRYKQLCADRGLKPKFEQFAGEPNYWKLLIDRKMINQETGALIRQMPVTPNFDFDAIKAVVDRYVANYDSNMEARALNHIVENWDSIPKRIRDLKKAKKPVKQSVNNLSNQTLAAKTSADLDAKWSVRDESLSVDSTEHERYEILKNVELDIVEIDENNLKDINLEDFNTRKQSKAFSGLRDLAKNLGIVGVNLENSRIDIPFQFSVKNLNKSTHHQLEYGGTYQDYVKALSCFNDLVKTAVPIEVHTEKKVGTSKANPDLKQTYVLLSTYRDGNTIVPVQMEVKEFYNYQNGLYMMVVLTKIDPEVMEKKLAANDGSMSSLFSKSTIMIADIFKNVNPKDGRFLKYVPDEFLNEEQRNAKRIALEKQEREYASYDEPKNSLRNEEDTSPRSILSRIDVNSRKLQAEKYHLERYQERIEKLAEQEKKLAQINTQIEELSVDKDKNRTAIRKLEIEANPIKSYINTLNKQLRQAERTDMFRKILAEERQKISKQQSTETLRAYKAEQRAKQEEMIQDYRALRKELTGTESNMAIIEREFIRLAKQYEKLDTKSGKSAVKNAQAIADLRAALRAEAASHKTDSKVWEREFNRLLREYETSGRRIAALEADIAYRKLRAKERVQSRHRTEMRHKIQRKANELNHLLLNGDKKRNVPIGLQKPVAAILDAINMEIRNADQRAKTYDATIARYDRLIDAESDPVVREGLVRSRDTYAGKGDQFAVNMQNLKKAYDDIKNDPDPLLQGVYDAGLSEHLEFMVDTIGDTPLGQMTMEQLETVNDVLNAVQTAVRNANKMLAEERRQGVDELSQASMREVRRVGGHKKETAEAVSEIKKFGWNNMKPIYAMETVGSNVLTDLFKKVRSGEDTWARDVMEAKDFFRRVSEEHGLREWDLEKKYSFTSASDMDFELTLEQIMSIYAYAKRDQARDHLRKGGIVFDPNTEVRVRTKLGIPIKFNPTEATAYNIDDVTLGEIMGKLSPAQKAFVDEMQSYLSDTMGAKGNDVSVKMHGIKLFKEKNYFPLRSASAYMAKANEQQKGDVKLKNAGFTKKTVPHASNPIVMTPFMQVWASHVDEMSMYHAFTLPLEDFYRVYNFHTPNMETSAAQSVRAAIQNAYGKGATDYIDQLLKDLNGGARSDSTAGFVNKLLSAYKKGSTMASASVVIQQPSAMVRAAAMIPYKYFIGPKVTEASHDKTWAEMKQYAPICTIKEMGYFDTNVGKSTVDFLTGVEYGGFKEKAKALLKDGDYRDEMLGRLPALADEFSWGAIWNAVKREQMDLHPGMKATDPKFLNMVAERFTDVIVHTQVYDSVLSRSANMRSKDTGMKMATAFMAEPTTNINIVANAILQGKRSGNWAEARKAIGAVVASQIMNAMLVSIVYAMRDDDEEERMDEKYISSLTENLISSLNPMGYIPYLRDVQSLFQGYNVERADMAVIGDIADAWRGLSDEDKTPWEKVETFTGAVCQTFGLPVKNILRDSKAVFNTLSTLANAESSTRTGLYIAAREALPFTSRLGNGEELLLAIQRGDEAHIQRVAGRFESQQKAESALQSAIRTQYLDGKLTAEEAMELLTTNFENRDAHDVYWILDGWDYAKVNGNTDGYSKMAKLFESMDTGANVETEIDRYLANGMDASDIKSEISKNYRKDYLAAGEADREAIREKVRYAYSYLGVSEADMDDKFRDWDFEAEYGMTYSDMKSAYRDGDVTEEYLRSAMQFYGRKRFEIEEDIRGLNEDIAFFERFGMSLSELKDGYDDGDVSRNTLISALEFTGKTRTQAQEEVSQRDIENRLGIDYMKLDDAYKWGDISRQTFYNAMIENGATSQEADEAILGYDWLKRHVRQYPDLAISDAKKFAVSLGSNAEDYTLEDFGVSIEAYQEYKTRKPECKGVDANGDGKTDSGTLRDSVFRMIDSLPISDEAKDGLALMSYSMSSIRKNAPWH